MGFLDKVKAAAKNVDSKAGEEIDKGKYRTKIADERREIEKLYIKLGTAYYECRKEDRFLPEDADSICKEIDERKAKIAEYEKKIATIEEEGKKEREQNNAEAETGSKAKEDSE